MSDLNSVSLVGRLTHDAEIKNNGNGKSWVVLNLANNYTYSLNKEKIDEANFFKIKIFGKLGESLQEYLVKGKQIGVQGRLKQYKYKNEDNKNMNVIEIIANQVQLISNMKTKRDID